jgi:HEAT repeat protein
MMKKPLSQRFVNTVTLLSVAYFATTFFLPESQILLWATASLIIFNFSLSLVELFRQGTITRSLVFLNLVQLILFGRLYLFIYDILGAEYYSSIGEPHWYDWITLVAVHVLRALDIIDFLNDYDIHLQNVTQDSTLVGITLVSMHIMVDIFILGAILIAINRRASNQQASLLSRVMEWFNKHIEFFQRLRFWVLWVIIGILIFVGIKDNWSLNNLLLVPIINIIRTLDIGDAFEIFDWQIYTVEMGFWLITLVVLFRLLISVYALGVANTFFLYLLGGRGKTLEELTDICISPDSSEEKRYIASKRLIKFHSSAVPVLTAALATSKRAEGRRTVVETLGEIGPAAVTAIPVLVKALVDRDARVQSAAAIALDEKIDPKWSQHEAVIDTIPHIVKVLIDSPNHVRSAAAETLGKMGPTAVKAIPDLVKALVDNDNHVRSLAVDALYKIEPLWRLSEEARSAIPYLERVASKYSRVERCALAVTILEQINPDWLSSKSASTAVPCLIQALAESNNIDIRRAVAAALDKIDPQWSQSENAFRAIPHIVKTLNDSNESVRRLATALLKKIDPTDEKTIPYLVKARTGSNRDNREVAAEAFKVLNEFEPQWPQNKAAFLTIPYLVTCLVKNDNDVRCASEEILIQIDPFWARHKLARRAIPYLLKALAAKENNIRCAAADVLKKMGPAAATVVPYLVKVLKDTPNAHVHWAVEAALKEIDPDDQWRKQKTAL